MNLASFRDFLVLFELCTFLQNDMFESQRKVTLQQPIPLRLNLLNRSSPFHLCWPVSPWVSLAPFLVPFGAIVTSL